MADPRVLRAMAAPLLGQFDPAFTAIMNEVMALTRFVFQTANARAFPVPGTGRAGLEAAIVSLVEPGDRVVVGECGRFGLLLTEIAERCGAEVVPVRAEWGRAIEPDAIATALRGGNTRMVAMIHGETSTGVLQPLGEIARLARAHEALLMADAVATLGGCPVQTTLGRGRGWRGREMSLVSPGWPHHHIAPRRCAPRAECRAITSTWPLRGLEAARYNHQPRRRPWSTACVRLRAIGSRLWRFARHRPTATCVGLAPWGCALRPSQERRLPFITPVVVPEGVDELRVRHRLIADFGIEIGAAFGPLQGRIWRIGTMGYSARRENILLCAALGTCGARAEARRELGRRRPRPLHGGGGPRLRVDESLGLGIGR
jgi:(S)-ureidoglycine-glyoxylate aminotransferase